jgi:hypothetical protein
MLTELKRTVHYLEQRLKRKVKPADLPQEKFGTAGNSGRYLRLLKLGAEFWQILDEDNKRPVEEQRLSISNISEATKETTNCTIMEHIRSLANAPQKIGKEPAKVLFPPLPEIIFSLTFLFTGILAGVEERSDCRLLPSACQSKRNGERSKGSKYPCGEKIYQ